jgi:hypothetical protein
MSNPNEQAFRPPILPKKTPDEEIRVFLTCGKKVCFLHPLAWTRRMYRSDAFPEQVEKFSELIRCPWHEHRSVAAKRHGAAVLNIKKTNLLCDFWPHGQLPPITALLRTKRHVQRAMSLSLKRER